MLAPDGEYEESKIKSVVSYSKTSTKISDPYGSQYILGFCIAVICTTESSVAITVIKNISSSIKPA